MESIIIPATDRSPEVDFNFSTGIFSISGESFPEDAAAFFGPLMQALKTYATTPQTTNFALELDFSYFNSSSAKALMNMFLLIEELAKAGAAVVVRWHYYADDDTMQEFGEDFATDFSAARFEMCEKAPA